MTRFLVVANQTAESDELIAHLSGLLRSDPGAEFVLLVPALAAGQSGGWEPGTPEQIAARRAADVAERLRERGLPVAEARGGDSSPVAAVEEELQEHRGYDAIVLATLPLGTSRWIRLDAVSRLRELTGIPVTHIPVARPAGREAGRAQVG